MKSSGTVAWTQWKRKHDNSLGTTIIPQLSGVLEWSRLVVVESAVVVPLILPGPAYSSTPRGQEDRSYCDQNEDWRSGA